MYILREDHVKLRETVESNDPNILHGQAYGKTVFEAPFAGLSQSPDTATGSQSWCDYRGIGTRRFE
jgi:hypothetical protein